MTFYRVLAPSPRFAGAQACLICHTNFHPEVAGWANTKHAHALETLKRIGQGNNSRCLACHTVGYGLPTGFTSEAQTPQLAGVQCENCHGPSGDHASAPFSNPTPVVSPDAQICGGCHTDFHHPTYDEWATSKHSIMDPHVINETTASSRIKQCGACHSGAARLAMLKSYEQNLPLDPLLPTAPEAAAHAVTCAACHDPHQQTGNDSQLRNPRSSSKFFSYNTSVSFAAQYDPTVNLCGQCHNMRGAAWRDTGRPPHHSPQYNILTGIGGYDIGPVIPQSFHRKIEKQCTHCHTHAHEAEPPTEENPNYTGHAFEPHLNACAPCHSEEEAELFVGWTHEEIGNRIAEVKGLLDTWGAMEAPAITNAFIPYGPYAWEYASAGQLSNPGGTNTFPGTTNLIVGPPTALQARIPDGIKQARFNLYLIEHDASKGVHNADYARYLLSVAEYLVNNEMDAAMAP
jgi:hypothetical protein